MSDEIELTKRVVGVLESMSVPYMIGGSMALIMWAGPRMTHDVDLVVDLPAERISEFCAHFPTEHYFIDADAMRTAFQHRDQPSQGMYSFIDMDTGFKVDLFPLRPGDGAQQEALKRRVFVELVEGQRAAVYAPDDLLVQKLRWYSVGQSEVQFRDCFNLLRTDLKRPTPLIEWEYIETWATRLGPEVQQAWARLKEAVRVAQARQHDAPE